MGGLLIELKETTFHFTINRKKKEFGYGRRELKEHEEKKDDKWIRKSGIE